MREPPRKKRDERRAEHDVNGVANCVTVSGLSGVACRYSVCAVVYSTTIIDNKAIYQESESACSSIHIYAQYSGV